MLQFKHVRDLSSDLGYSLPRDVLDAARPMRLLTMASLP